MAEPFDTWAEALLAAIAAEDVDALAAVLADLTPDALVQLQQSMTLLGRYDGLLFTDGPPSDTVGAPGAVAIDVENGIFYPPKDAVTGWPEGREFLKGDKGDTGDDGREVQLRKTATQIQWRYAGEAAWTDLVALAELKGADGSNGADGSDGADGADGSDGADGREVEFRVSGGAIQWRLTGGDWADLVSLDDLKGDTGDQGDQGDAGEDGDDGRDPEFQKSATHLQWRLTGDTEWIDLVPLADLKGDPGEDGEDGEGAGDVIGPASSIDGQLSVFDGTTGKRLKAVSATKALVGLGAVDNTSDADKPVSTAQQTALDGKADLVGGKVSTSQLPALAITDVFEVANQSAMLALTAERGDVAIRTDENKSYVLAAEPPSTLGNWKLLRTPTDLVLSVAGQTGAVTASALKAALAYVIADVSGLQDALDAKLALAGGVMTGRLKLKALTEVRGSVSTGALDVSVGTIFEPSWSSNTTVSLANLPSSPTAGDTVTATIKATITGSPVLTWPSGTKWIGGSAPTVAAGTLFVTLVATWTGSAWAYVASGGMAS